MKLFDFAGKRFTESAGLQKEYCESDALFIVCGSDDEVRLLSKYYGFDESTVLECFDLDESIRYMSFDGYDFVSAIHMEISGEHFILKEINLYVSKKYLVLVMPTHGSPKLELLEAHVLKLAENAMGKQHSLNRIYFEILSFLLADYSDMLEEIEDRMEELSEKIISHVEKTQFMQIYILRRMAYTAKKQLRALSYVGSQMLVDENRVIEKKQIVYFSSIDTRIKKLFDFAESLYNLSTGLIGMYDGKMSTKTNDMINKLTVITLLFAPLTLITGIYGMNFDFMPELKMRYGYFAVLLFMILISGLLCWILRRKNWL